MFYREKKSHMERMNLQKLLVLVIISNVILKIVFQNMTVTEALTA